MIINPEEYCYLDGYVGIDQHSACAAFLLQELVEKLTVEDIGELLIQPFGYTSELLNCLIDTSLYGKIATIKKGATKILIFLLRRIADADILYLVSPGPGSPPTPTYVPNRLHPLRERIIGHIHARMEEFLVGLEQGAKFTHMEFGDKGWVRSSQTVDEYNNANNNNQDYNNQDNNNPEKNNNSPIVSTSVDRVWKGVNLDDINNSKTFTEDEILITLGVESRSTVQYSAYQVPYPFTVLRSNYMDLLTLMVESDDTVAALIPSSLWLVSCVCVCLCVRECVRECV